MSSLTALIQNMIDENKATQEKLDTTLLGFEHLKEIVNTQTSDTHLLELITEEFYKSEYFNSEEFYKDVGKTLVQTHGLENLITLDKEQVNNAVFLYLNKNLDVEGIVNALMKHHTLEIREAMTRRIRLESKSILDNYDFSIQVVPRLQNLFNEFMKNNDLTGYLLRSSAQLFIAQETNLAIILEYIVTRDILER